MTDTTTPPRVILRRMFSASCHDCGWIIPETDATDPRALRRLRAQAARHSRAADSPMTTVTQTVRTVVPADAW